MTNSWRLYKVPFCLALALLLVSLSSTKWADWQIYGSVHQLYRRRMENVRIQSQMDTETIPVCRLANGLHMRRADTCNVHKWDWKWFVSYSALSISFPQALTNLWRKGSTWSWKPSPKSSLDRTNASPPTTSPAQTSGQCKSPSTVRAEGRRFGVG